MTIINQFLYRKGHMKSLQEDKIQPFKWNMAQELVL